MFDRTPRALRVGFETGRVSGETVIDRALPALDAATIGRRRATLAALTAAADSQPEQATEIFDAVESSIGPGAIPTRAELAALGDLGCDRPRAFTPLVETFRRPLAHPDDSAIDHAALSALLGDIGTAAPGVVKPLLGPLVALTANDYSEHRVEAAWAVVRIAASEPTMLRPLVAGLVWDLDSEDPATVCEALATLGRIGQFLPDHLAGLDTVASLLDHPSPEVRAAAVETLGDTAGRGAKFDTGVPAPARVEPFLDGVAARGTDSDPAVRAAAVETLGQVARHEPRFAETYSALFLTATADDDRRVRIAALDAIADTFEPSAFDRDRFLRYAVGRLTDGDDDVAGAAVDALLAAARALRSDHPETARYLVDVLTWFQLSPHGGLGVPDPIEELGSALVGVVDRDRYLQVARTLRDAEDSALRHAGLSICETIVCHADSHRLAAVGILQSLLADEDEHVRRRVLSVFERLAEDTPALSPVLGQIAWPVAAYDPAVRPRAVAVLVATGQTDARDRLGPVAVQCRVLRERRDAEDDGDGLDIVDSEPESSPLQRLAEATPRAVTDAAPTLVEFLSEEGDVSVATALATAVAEGGRLAPETVRRIEAVVRSASVSPPLLAWLSTALFLGGDEAVQRRARDRLHSLAERREETPLLACLSLLVDHDPVVVAEILCSYPPAESLSTPRAERLAALVTAHPRLSLRCRTGWSPFPDGARSRERASQTAWPAALAEHAPQTVPARDWLADRFWTDDGELTASLLDTMGRADTLPGTDAWRRHPHPAVRDAARGLLDGEAATDRPDPVDPSAATTDTVAEVASRLASTARDRCRRACERLVSIAARDPSLRPAVRQHLLASSVALSETAAPTAVLGALSTLAPRPDQPGGRARSSVPPAERVAPLLCQYAAAPSPGVRDVALSALRVRGGDESAALASVVIERLRDPSGAVRAQAAHTAAALVGDALAVTPSLVDALVDAVDGPRYVAVAACHALGRCGATEPSVTDRVVAELTTHLRARERGVRRSAAGGLARIGHADPGALAPVADTLCDRIGADRVTWPALFPVVSMLRTHDAVTLDSLARARDEASDGSRCWPLTALVSETPPCVTRAAGRLLVAAAEDTPGTVHGQLNAVGERLHEEYDEEIVTNFQDITTSPLSTYWLFRVVATCARANHTVTASFEWALAETVDFLTSPAAASPHYDLPRDSLTTDGLATVTARAAGLGGDSSYETILESWPGEPTKPALDPTVIAQFLVLADEPTRTRSFEHVATALSPADRDDVLAALLSQSVNLHRYEAVFASLTRLLPLSDDERLHRRGVATLLDACEAHNWEVRVNAIEALATLGTTAVLPADEAIGHLLGQTGREPKTQEAIADAVLDLLGHAERTPETVATAMVVRYERGGPARRRLAVWLLGRLATRHATVRSRAVATLLAALSDSDRWARERAGEDLAALAAIDPEPLAAHRERLERQAARADGEVADDLRTCLSELDDRE
ncbi:HEAT repeat domain-containing protein (plasmid) [Halomicrobium sp. HM KBTZ05]|uniref:HEAT repeat domain-containing protein n=1 Tax=Halomicrobium sp. HM KBTZ05 TaxID=3242663 RepID=UPI003556D19A